MEILMLDIEKRYVVKDYCEMVKFPGAAATNIYDSLLSASG